MFCTSCGHQIRQDAKFCERCGVVILASAPVAPSVQFSVSKTGPSAANPRLFSPQWTAERREKNRRQWSLLGKIVAFCFAPFVLLFVMFLVFAVYHDITTPAAQLKREHAERLAKESQEQEAKSAEPTAGRRSSQQPDVTGGGSKTTVEEALNAALIPWGKKFADDVKEVHSNLYDEDVRSYNDMPEAEFTLGAPNKVLSFPDSSCASQPLIVDIYNDLGLPLDVINRKSYALVYQNLYCQPDARAYVLIGIHPIPGLWWNIVFPSGKK